MLELMRIGDVIKSQNGIVFGGTNEKFENISYLKIKKILQIVSKVDYIDKHQIQRSVKIVSSELHSSIGNNFNIFLLIDEFDPEKIPDVGEVIYCGESEELNSILNQG
jgi:hypothetical protein